jgi:microcystin-dependent protein
VVEDEFQHLIAKIKAWALVEHNEDGTHFIKPSGFDFVPTGAILQWPTDTPPAGWALCNGQQLSRVDYAALFNAIGTTYGSGDGSTTFTVPDLRGRFPIGKAASGTASTLASTGGALDHTHSVSSSTTSSAGSHNHGGSTDNGGRHDHGGSTGSEGSHTHGFSGTTGFARDGSLAPNYNYAAGTSASHVHDYGGTTDAGSAHSHSITQAPDHTHSISSDGSHTHTVSSSTTGGSNPPYLVVNYIILTGRR